MLMVSRSFVSFRFFNMFLKVVFIVVTAFATHPVADHPFSQSESFVSRDDRNDYEARFETAREPIPSNFAPVNRRKPYLYTQRHMEIIKEIAEGRIIGRGGQRSVDELFRESEELFKSANLNPMNENTFKRYLSQATIGKRTKSRNSSSFRASTSSWGSQKNDYTKAHCAIMQEVVRRSIEARNLLEERAFREVCEQFRAQKLEPISRAVFNSFFRNIVARQATHISSADIQRRGISSKVCPYGAEDCCMRKKSKPSIDPEIERVLQLIIDENHFSISSDRVYAALRTKLPGNHNIPTFRQVHNWMQSKRPCSSSAGTVRSIEVDPYFSEVLAALLENEEDNSGGPETAILSGDKDLREREATKDA